MSMNSIKEAFPEFPKPSVAIDTVVLRVKDISAKSNKHVALKQLQVLLIKEKGTSTWHLPGTILRLGETPLNAIDRIMQNKVSVNEVYFEQLYTVADNPERDERGHIISMVYIGILKNGDDMIVYDQDRYDAAWALVEKTAGNDTRTLYLEETDEKIGSLLYDHDKIISDSINRLKGKLLYTDIGFHFMEEKFTIKELENCFNAVNERVIPGFRRVIKNKVVGTEEISDDKAFRPAELFIKKE